MSYRTILVHTDRNAEGRLKTAADLARRFDAVLVGLAAEAVPIARYDAELGFYPSAIPDAELGQIREDLTLCEGRFTDVCEKAGIQYEWHTALDLPGDAVIEHARRADLVVVGQFTGNADNSPDPGDLLMRIGRPLLILPDEQRVVDAKRVIIAWKDTREARRAIVDSLPLLKVAESVRLVAMGASPATRPRDDLTDAKIHLARHGVVAESEMRDPGDASVEQALIDLAQSGADLLVAGGYGHSRLREWVLGGMTRALLNEPPIAVLLSH